MPVIRTSNDQTDLSPLPDGGGLFIGGRGVADYEVLDFREMVKVVWFMALIEGPLNRDTSVKIA